MNCLIEETIVLDEIREIIKELKIEIAKEDSH